jgi:hypothetical protein
MSNSPEPFPVDWAAQLRSPKKNKNIWDAR